ncbi:MAG: hypothetical protein ACQJCO_06490 [cyanobacterium endosymbiont of Rhopalodia sterrenbergii]
MLFVARRQSENICRLIEFSMKNGYGCGVRQLICPQNTLEPRSQSLVGTPISYAIQSSVSIKKRYCLQYQDKSFKLWKKNKSVVFPKILKI